MDTPSAPAAPDPAKTAAAQAQANKDTAVAQYGLNATNQVTPQGSLTYKQIGTWPDGTPRYEATTALNAGEQGIYDTGVQTRQNVANIGRDQSARIGELLGKPVDLSNEAVESRLYDLGSKRLDPRFAQQSAALEADLLNRGIRPGSEAYANAHTALEQSKNDAYNQLLLNGRGQAVQEALTQRNQPINEISALMSGSQISQPNYVTTPSTQLPTVDQAGLINQNYQNQVGAYNTQLQQSNAAMGGLFGLGSSLLGGWALSDRRAKTNIRRVGLLRNGLPVYAFSYRDGGPEQVGLMSDDVREKHPEAVFQHVDGFDRVNYEQAVI